MSEGVGAVATPTDPGTGRPALNHQRGRRFLEIRARLEEIEDEAKRLREEQRELEDGFFAEIEETGVPSFVVEHDGQQYTLFVRHEVRATTLDHAAVVAWFNANGLGSKVQVPNASMLSIVKEYVSRGEPLPPGLRDAVSTFDQHFLRARKKK